jgi:ABC-type Fe3+ transport system substrate-binding protein
MRAWLRDFEAAYPGITVQHQQFPSPSQFVPKVTEEQKAGVFEWDLYQTYATVAMPALRPINALAPIRPLIFNRPDVMDDKNWTNGFEGGWQDNDKQFGYGFSYQVNGLCAINTDLVQTSDFKTLDDMANPKWKGKMAFPDVRSGKTYGSMSVVLEKRGEEFVRKLIIEQEPFFSQDIRRSWSR